MKFIIASDSFKGSLSSNQVNNIIESKVKEIFPKSFCEKMLIADGGEGTLEAIYGESGNGYDKIVIDTVNPLGKKIDGYYLRKGNIAVMEFDGVTKFGNSQLDEEGDSAYTNFKGDKTTLVLQTKSPKFKTTVVGNHDRFGDSEAKLFEYAASVAGDGKEHTLNLLSERCMCESCRGVMQSLKRTFQMSR